MLTDLGYAQPVGRVIAYEKQIIISGVGFDIGCGNMAVRLDTPFRAIEDRVGTVIKNVSRMISVGIGRTNEERVEHELLDDADAWRESDMEGYRQNAGAQLGTVGSGNHYADVMRDEEGFVWIGVHFGSHGLGHTSAMRYLKAAGGKDGMNVRPAYNGWEGRLTAVVCDVTNVSATRYGGTCFNGRRAPHLTYYQRRHLERLLFCCGRVVTVTTAFGSKSTPVGSAKPASLLT